MVAEGANPEKGVQILMHLWDYWCLFLLNWTVSLYIWQLLRVFADNCSMTENLTKIAGFLSQIQNSMQLNSTGMYLGKLYSEM